ncbi:MAG: hypothetical protein KIT69_16920, partial [Propionibacteriaceae bacterium]|nr:hypothetical protein [Propionibacteriaceae bacterium]
EFPSDFPDGVPVPDGKLASTLVAESTWALTYEGIEKAEIDRLTAELETAGFHDQGVVNAENALQAGFQNEQWDVTILWDGTSKSLVYAVTKAS